MLTGMAARIVRSVCFSPILFSRQDSLFPCITFLTPLFCLIFPVQGTSTSRALFIPSYAPLLSHNCLIAAFGSPAVSAARLTVSLYSIQFSNKG